MKAKYQLGTVLSNGGVVWSIHHPEFYSKSRQGQASINSDLWTDNFPDWQEKPIYVIQLETKVKPLTMDEFKDCCPHIRDEYLMQEYQKIPEVEFMSIPEDQITQDMMW